MGTKFPENPGHITLILWVGKALAKMGFSVRGGTEGSLEEGYPFPCLIMDLPVNPGEHLDPLGLVDQKIFDQLLLEHLNPFDHLLTAYYAVYPLEEKNDEFRFSTDGDKLRFKPISGTLQPHRPRPEQAAKLTSYQQDLARIAAYLQMLFPDLAKAGTHTQLPTEEEIRSALHHSL